MVEYTYLESNKDCAGRKRVMRNQCVTELSSRENKVVLIRSFSGIIVRICCLEDD